jgi:hypothetical protein
MSEVDLVVEKLADHDHRDIDNEDILAITVSTFLVEVTPPDRIQIDT